MRFLVDECTGPNVAEWLRKQNHEVFSVFDEARGMDDEAIIKKAYAENWILIANDKDFGEKIYREHHSHKGLILLRLEDESSANKIETLRKLFKNFAMRLGGQFVVVTEDKIRFAVRHI